MAFIATSLAAENFDDNRETEVECRQKWPQEFITHRLHPHHQLRLAASVGGVLTFRCEACLQPGLGNRYHCEPCNFELHTACAMSDETINSLMAKETTLETIVHEHPLNLVTGSSSYTCKHCRLDSKSKYRYKCGSCKKNFHMMCVAHPTRLLSFFHPNHELKLKTRHHFTRCDVCQEKGHSNSSVYSCELCEYYVHPECATMAQYSQHRIHGDHTLVLRQVTGDETTICMICRKKCKQFYDGCYVCKDVNFHHECLNPPGQPSATSEFLQASTPVVEAVLEVIEAVVSSINED